MGMKQAAVNDRAVAPMVRASMGDSSLSDFLQETEERDNKIQLEYRVIVN